MDDVPPVGSCIASRYVVDAVIGAGGMSVVLRARDLRLDSPVALKVLRRSLALHRSQLARFVREARIVARLTSDHVVRILDVDATADPPYIAMELVVHGDVARLISDQGRLPAPLAVAIVIQACRGVAEAHAIGVVHRDLKPSNLLVARTAEGEMRIKVGDFGISKIIDPTTAPDLTSSGQILGSPRYMSPEQVRSGSNIDGRADVWALGAILFELISGAGPFDAGTVPDTLARIVSEAPPPLEGAGVSPRLSAVVAMCLQKNPALRPPSVTALLQELLATEAEWGGSTGTSQSTPLRPERTASGISELESVVVGRRGSRPPATGLLPRRAMRWTVAGAGAAVVATTLAVVATKAPSRSPVRTGQPAVAGSATVAPGRKTGTSLIAPGASPSATWRAPVPSPDAIPREELVPSRDTAAPGETAPPSPSPSSRPLLVAPSDRAQPIPQSAAASNSQAAARPPASTARPLPPSVVEHRRGGGAKARSARPDAGADDLELDQHD